MRSYKTIITWLFMLLSLSCCVEANASANQSDPVSLLQYIADNMISGLKHNKATLKSNPQSVYNLAYRFVVPYADLAEMSRRVLPPQIWNQAAASQRLKFQKEFTKTLIRTYASALTSYDNESIQFYPVRGGFAGKQTIEVSSVINGAEQPIQVSYRLVRKGNAWRLYDMSVEGISMLESFRSQFSDILSSGSMNELLSKMSAHNAR